MPEVFKSVSEEGECDPRECVVQFKQNDKQSLSFPWDGEGIWTYYYGELLRLPSSDQEEKEGGRWGGGDADAVDKSWSKRESIWQR